MELSIVRPRFSLCWLMASPLFLSFLLVVLPPISSARAAPRLQPSMFVFGASMVDSGTNSYVLPYRSPPDFNPYGSDYFGKPVGRWSNGRTFMDIITQSLGLGFLDPFVKSMGANFTHGVNFACAGSTAQNSTRAIFPLLVQVDQFEEYQNLLLAEQKGANAHMSMFTAEQARLHEFAGSIFFMETANNDLVAAGLDSAYVEIVELVIVAMRRALERLYALGGRTFIVMNVTPIGCSPALLSSTLTSNYSSRDENNCSAAWNDFVSLHNRYLVDLLDELRSKYASAEWILFDAYSLFLDGYRNPSNYGIKYPFQACCGAGGPYNFKKDSLCGEAGKYIDGALVQATKCEDPSAYLIWDTFHPTESFCQYIAQGVVHGTHLIPTFNLTHRVRSMQNMQANYGRSRAAVPM